MNDSKMSTNENMKSIVIFRTSNENSDINENILWTAQLLSRIGYPVKIVTCFDVADRSQIAKSCTLHEIGGWIPKITQSFTKILRTLYSSSWLIMKKRQLDPSVIFVSEANFVIPFLKTFGRFKILYYHNNAQKLTINNAAQDIMKHINIYGLYFLKFCDEILVPDEVTKQVFEHLCLNSEVMYPCLRIIPDEFGFRQINGIIPDIKVGSIVFALKDEFLPSSGIHLAVKAFVALLSQLKNKRHRIYKKTFLVLYGCRDDQSIQQERYIQKLIRLGLEAVRNNVCFLLNISSSQEQIIFNECTSVLFTSTVTNPCPRQILNCLYTGKLIIAVQSPIAKEFIRHGITGYLCESSAKHLQQYMFEVCTNGFKTDRIILKAKSHFEFQYSVNSYINKLHELFNRHYDIKPIEQNNNKELTDENEALLLSTNTKYCNSSDSDTSSSSLEDILDLKQKQAIFENKRRMPSRRSSFHSIYPKPAEIDDYNVHLDRKHPDIICQKTLCVNRYTYSVVTKIRGTLRSQKRSTEKANTATNNDQPEKVHPTRNIRSKSVDSKPLFLLTPKLESKNLLAKQAQAKVDNQLKKYVRPTSAPVPRK